MAVEEKKISNRQRLVDRFSKDNPDYNVDDDETLYGSAADALDASDESAAQRQRLNESLSQSEIAPELVAGIVSGKNADGSDFDLEDYLFTNHLDFLLDYAEDNEGARQKWDERKASRKAEAEAEAEFAKGRDERIQKEDKELDAAIAESGYRPEQVQDLIDWIYDAENGFVKRAANFELTKDDFSRLFKIKDYDIRMTEAEDKGYKRGKNERIDMLKRDTSRRENLPPDLSGGGAMPKTTRRSDPTLDALSKMRGSVE